MGEPKARKNEGVKPACPQRGRSRGGEGSGPEGCNGGREHVAGPPERRNPVTPRRSPREQRASLLDDEHLLCTTGSDAAAAPIQLGTRSVGPEPKRAPPRYPREPLALGRPRGSARHASSVPAAAHCPRADPGSGKVRRAIRLVRGRARAGLLGVSLRSPLPGCLRVFTARLLPPRSSGGRVWAARPWS